MHSPRLECPSTRWAVALLVVTASMPCRLPSAERLSWQDPPAQGEPPPTPAAAAAPDAPAADSPAAAASKPIQVRGMLRARYYSRWTGADSDNDLVTTLSVDVGDADHDDVTGHLMGRAAYDFDGRDDTFTGLSDSYGGRFDALLYDAYVDLHHVTGFSLVRFGRQPVYETPEVAYLDGVHVTSQEMGDLAFQLGAYVGSSTHLYESSKTGDLTAGGYAQARPWSQARLRFDYMYLEDDARLGNHENDLVGVGFWQNIGESLQLDAQYSRIENRDRDVLGRAVYHLVDWGLLVQATYFKLLTTQGDLVLEADPYFHALNELHPYDQWSFLASKQVAKMLQLQAAADLRRVSDRTDIGFYNRDYDHYYGTV
ncbi:MAG TPA: hypothetical protein VFZ65_05505, partial [Planctomycetota bacterium]|nr:hypothetical protein [Planctomycetota bacterium]